ncbi:MAG TPA: cytochrome c oxidase accessory protein CcoG, partial [Cytophagales bacterium]|nr:cytochrome c oxidase accessory protein CcoG [Cytophagales bacterium]
YASFNSIEKGKTRLVTPRIMGYAAVLTILVSVLSYFIFTRADIETTILKAPGTLYTRLEDGQISNLYTIEFLNKTFDDMPLDVRLEGPTAATLLKIGADPVVVPHEGILKRNFMVKIPESELSETRTVPQFGIYQGDKKIVSAKARFVGPMKMKKS